jgi:ankyrin repeat protein
LDINQPYKVGPSLYSAAAQGHDSIVHFLLESGADIEGEGPNDCGTALRTAAYKGHTTIVQLLLKYGADVNACDAKNGIAVAGAAHHDDIPMILLLLERGANLNLAGEYGSPLSYAAAWAGENTVKLLLEHGAHVEVDSINALKAAIDSYRKEDNVRTILHHAVGFDHALAPAIVKAAEKGHNGLVDLLLKHGADINSVIECRQLQHFNIYQVLPRTKQMITPLSEAVRRGERSTVKLLLDRGAKPNVNGGQALQSCILKPDYDQRMMEFLLRYGADVNTVGGEHGSALIAACSKRGIDVVKIDVVRRFLELKADINPAMSKANSSPTSGKSLMSSPQAASTGAHSMQRRTGIR